MRNVILKPGDKVIISNYLYGTNYFAGFAWGMCEYCGKVMTIAAVAYVDDCPEHILYYLKEDFVGYVWSIDMFDVLVTDPVFLNLKLFI